MNKHVSASSNKARISSKMNQDHTSVGSESDIIEKDIRLVEKKKSNKGSFIEGISISELIALLLTVSSLMFSLNAISSSYEIKIDDNIIQTQVLQLQFIESVLSRAGTGEIEINLSKENPEILVPIVGLDKPYDIAPIVCGLFGKGVNDGCGGEGFFKKIQQSSGSPEVQKEMIKNMTTINISSNYQWAARSYMDEKKATDNIFYMYCVVVLFLATIAVLAFFKRR